MTKKFYYLGLALSMTYTWMEAQNILYLQGDPHVIKNSGHRREIPIIDYDNFVVSVNSTALISNVKIVITDTQGKVIYNKRMDILPTSNVLDIPEEYVQGKYKIELVYEDKSTLFGFFEPAE